MFTNPYSGKFDLMQGVQQILPMITQYLLWKELMDKGNGDPLKQAAGIGMASPESMGGIAGGTAVPPSASGMPMPTTPTPRPNQMPPNLMQQAPSGMQGPQGMMAGGPPIGADMSRINQMLKMKQMMGTDQPPMPPQMPQQQGGGLMQLLPILISLLA